MTQENILGFKDQLPLTEIKYLITYQPESIRAEGSIERKSMLDAIAIAQALGPGAIVWQGGFFYGPGGYEYHMSIMVPQPAAPYLKDGSIMDHKSYQFHYADYQNKVPFDGLVPLSEVK